MRGGYHIRISVTKPPEPDLASPSSSFTNQSSPLLRNTQHIPVSLFEPLPAHPSRSLGRRNTSHHSRSFSLNSGTSSRKGESTSSSRDYRYGPLRVDWVDFEPQVKLDSGKVGNSALSRKMSFGKEKAGSKGPQLSHFP